MSVMQGRKTRGGDGGHVPSRIWSGGDANGTRPPPDFDQINV